MIILINAPSSEYPKYTVDKEKGIWSTVSLIAWCPRLSGSRNFQNVEYSWVMSITRGFFASNRHWNIEWLAIGGCCCLFARYEIHTPKWLWWNEHIILEYHHVHQTPSRSMNSSAFSVPWYWFSILRQGVPITSPSPRTQQRTPSVYLWRRSCKHLEQNRGCPSRQWGI